MSNPGSPPAAPNTGHVAIGLLVAESMTKSNNASQKQLESQKEIGEQFMEQNIANAIQQIIENAPDHTTALAEIKKFLGEMNADDSTWGSDIQSWISGELKTADSYSAPSDLLDQLNDDMQQLQADEQSLQEDEGNLNACESKKNDLEAQLAHLKDEWNNTAWYNPKRIELAAEIAGVGIAIGAVYVGIGACEAAVALDKLQIKQDQEAVSKDEQKIRNDPALTNTLQMLSGGNNLMQSEANENITGYKSTQKEIEAFDKSIDGLIEEITSSKGSAA